MNTAPDDAPHPADVDNTLSMYTTNITEMLSGLYSQTEAPLEYVPSESSTLEATTMQATQGCHTQYDRYDHGRTTFCSRWSAQFFPKTMDDFRRRLDGTFAPMHNVPCGLPRIPTRKHTHKTRVCSVTCTRSC